MIHGSKDEKNTQHNYFILTVYGDQLNLYAVNLVKKFEVRDLSKRIDGVNKMIGDNNLRESYMKQLTNNQFSEKGGGGLGFLKMALVTEKPIAFEFISCSGKFVFFNMKIKFSIAESSLNNKNNFHKLLDVIN